MTGKEKSTDNAPDRRSAVERLVMPEWIPAENRKPEHFQYVLVWPLYVSTVFPDEPRHVLQYRDDMSCNFVYYLGDSLHGTHGWKCEKWMPLPEA